MSDLAGIAREVIRANLYMALGTADADGTPWVSPVYYVADGFTTFYWVSSPDARHSRNIAVRRSVSIAIYDSRSVIGRAVAVYLATDTNQKPNNEQTKTTTVYNRRLPEEKRFAVDELLGPSPF